MDIIVLLASFLKQSMRTNDKIKNTELKGEYFMSTILSRVKVSYGQYITMKSVTDLPRSGRPRTMDCFINFVMKGVQFKLQEPILQ